MRFLSKAKDGGPRSPVDAYFLIELKNWFSIALLKFNKGSREEYHTHAFNAYTWFLKGQLVEESIEDTDLFKDVIRTRPYKRRLKPKFTPRDQLHRVKALADSWCFTVRGPWVDRWIEFNDNTNTTTVLTNGREVVERMNWLQRL